MAGGRADLHALHEGAHRFKHLLRYENTFAASGLGRVSLGHAEHDFLRHGNAQVVLHVFGVAQTGKRPDGGNDGNAEAFYALEKMWALESEAAVKLKPAKPARRKRVR